MFENTNGKKEFIDGVGNFNVEEYIIPEGIKEFDLSWIKGSTITNFYTGDEVVYIKGSFWMIDGLKKIVIGQNVSRIDFYSISDDIAIEVNNDNVNYVSNNGSLYRVSGDCSEGRCLGLIRHPTNSAEVVSAFDKNGIKYHVESIGGNAFEGCESHKITLNDGIRYLDLSAFDDSEIVEVSVPDSIMEIYGRIYWFTEAQSSGMDFKSPDGNTVRTVNGMVYLTKDGSKSVVQYVGGSDDTIYIEDGTVTVSLGTIDRNSAVQRIIIPSTVEYVSAQHSYRSPDIDILAPSSIDADCEIFHIRQYTVSDYHTFTFLPSEGGLKVSVKLNHAYSPTILFGDSVISEGSTILWDSLFPASDSGKPGLYREVLTVSYEIEKHKVSFNTGSSNTSFDKEVQYGKCVDIPSDPINPTTIFIGWFTDEKFESEFDFDTPITEDMVLYAKWRERPEPDPEPQPQPVARLNISLSDGVRFVVIDNSWYENGVWDFYCGEYTIGIIADQSYEGTPVIKLDGVTITGDTITLGKDSKNLTVGGLAKKTNMIHFVNNVSKGVCSADSMNVISGESFALPSVKASDGYRFVGWTDGWELFVDDFKTYSDITLSAAYVRDPQKLDTFYPEYSVTMIVPENGTLASSAVFKADEGDIVSLPSVVPASGYKFNGWMIDGRNIGTSLTVQGDVTLTASMSKSGSSTDTPTKPVDPKPDTPTKPDVPKPEPSKPNEKVNEDGSITVIEKKEDGSSTETTTKNNDDGSTTVKTEEKDKDGNTTGTTTKVTNSDGSSTEVKESKTENGSSVKEEKFDKNGNSLGSTTKVTEKITTDSGSTIETEKVTASDGSGDKIAETFTAKAESDNGKLKSEATKTEKDGTIESSVKTTIKSDSVDGKVDVDNSSIDDALKQMDDVAGAIGETGSKLIEIGTKKTTDSTEVSISAESMQKISDAGADVKIAGDVGSITVGTDVSKNLADKSGSGQETKPISMSIGKADMLSMTDKQRQAVGNAKVVRLQASVGDESVHELGGDVTVTIPYVLSPGENPDLVRVYYVDDVGGLHMKLSKYDPATHTVSFVTDHFSYYMIAQEVGAEQSGGDGGDEGFPIIAAVAVVVVVAVLAAAVVYRRAR